MKIWSVKSTVYWLVSQSINLFNLHFINNACSYSLILFRMGFLGLLMEVGVCPPSLKSVTHILQWWNLANLKDIAYLRKTQKTYKSRDTSLEFCWHHHFFTRNQQILLHQEIQIYIGFWSIIYNSVNFSWVLNNCFNRHGYNFDDVSKNGYSRSSQNKGILKERLWRHNFCPWRHQQIFITWFKLYYRCGHVTKVL